MKKFNKVIIASAVVLVFGLVVAGTIKAYPPTPLTVDLGSADSFSILAGSNITDVGGSTITGDVGLSPATGASIGLLSSQVTTGTIYAVNAAGPAGSVEDPTLLTAAKSALTAAYTTTSNRTGYAPLASEELGGATWNAGLYTYDFLQITGTTTLDGQGDPNAVFIFKAASTLTTAVGSVVNLVNGANACNVFWVVGSANGQLGADSIFKGTIMANQLIALGARANVEGRLLSFSAAVTLGDHNVIAKPTCTVVAPQPTLVVTKIVVNTGGGTKAIADFPLFVSTTAVTSSVTNTFAPGTYTVSETNNTNYTQAFSGDCPGGIVNLALSDIKSCTITNTYIAPVVQSFGGGSYYVPPVPPLIDVVKTPYPLSLPGGPGLVTYTYTLKNIGTVPVTDITMVGDTCSPIVLNSGDTNGDKKLGVTETWVYKCSTTLSKTHTNTVVATGWANGISAIDIASATVVVGLPIVPPLIHVVKVPSPLTLPAGGGMVTYTYTVTNPGTVPLSNVTITDDKCTGLPGRVIGHPGDLNKNNLLESNESWQFTCKSNLKITTTNTATASGEANGLTAKDYAIATVVVATVAIPKLPATGVSPVTGNIPWNVMALAGIIIVTLVSLAVAFRKRAV